MDITLIARHGMIYFRNSERKIVPIVDSEKYRSELEKYVNEKMKTKDIKFYGNHSNTVGDEEEYPVEIIYGVYVIARIVFVVSRTHDNSEILKETLIKVLKQIKEAVYGTTYHI